MKVESKKIKEGYESVGDYKLVSFGASNQLNEVIAKQNKKVNK